MRIAILGGSFNPVHAGHFALADEVCTSLHYDRVLFVPVFRPPHKEMNDALSPQERLNLVRAACHEDERFIAESCEIDRGGMSYTYDTILELEKKYACQLEGKIGLIMGDDLLPGFHLWNHAAEIARRCELILAQRPYMEDNGQFSNRPVGAYASASYKDNLNFTIESEPLFKDAVRLTNAILPISSTDIRTRIAEGRGFKYLVSPAVFKYIREGRLYGYSQY